MEHQEIMEQQRRELQFLFSYPGNVTFYNKAINFLLLQEQISPHLLSPHLRERLQKEGKNLEDAISSVILAWMKLVFSILINVHLFMNKHPFECIEWVRNELKGYDCKMREILRGLLLDGLHDKQRFQNLSPMLQHIINEISLADRSDLPINPAVSHIKFFIGAEPVSVESFVNSCLCVWGLLPTKEQQAKTFLDENRDIILHLLEAEKKEFPGIDYTKDKNDFTLTHREVIFAHNLYKVKTEGVSHKNGNQWYIENGKRGKWKAQYSTTYPGHKKYKAPDEIEMQNICRDLEGLECQKIAINDLWTRFRISYR